MSTETDFYRGETELFRMIGLACVSAWRAGRSAVRAIYDAARSGRLSLILTGSLAVQAAILIAKVPGASGDLLALIAGALNMIGFAAVLIGLDRAREPDATIQARAHDARYDDQTRAMERTF